MTTAIIIGAIIIGAALVIRDYRRQIRPTDKQLPSYYSLEEKDQEEAELKKHLPCNIVAFLMEIREQDKYIYYTFKGHKDFYSYRTKSWWFLTDLDKRHFGTRFYLDLDENKAVLNYRISFKKRY